MFTDFLKKKKKTRTDLSNQVAFFGSDPVVFEVETILELLLLIEFLTLTITDIDEGIFGLIIFIVRMFKKKKVTFSVRVYVALRQFYKTLEASFPHLFACGYISI